MTRSGKTKAPPSSLPPAPAPALFLVRTRPRNTTATSKVMGVDCSPSPRRPSTPPLRSRVTVPFLWEDAPGKPKLRRPAPQLVFPSAAAASPALVRDHEGGAAVPLKLPPRLQTAAEYSVVSSPSTVLHGPYLGGKTKPPRPRPLRRSESAASRLLSWRKAAAASKSKKGGHDHDAPDASCCSPPGSSASSSSSSSMSYFFDDQSRRSHWRQQADAREESEDGEEDGGAAQGSVRITRFRRNSSLPNITTSRLWVSFESPVSSPVRLPRFLCFSCLALFCLQLNLIYLCMHTKQPI